MTALCVGPPTQLLSTQPPRASLAGQTLRLRSSAFGARQRAAPPHVPCAHPARRRQSPKSGQSPKTERASGSSASSAQHSPQAGQDDSQFQDVEYDKLADEIRVRSFSPCPLLPKRRRMHCIRSRPHSGLGSGTKSSIKLPFVLQQQHRGLDSARAGSHKEIHSRSAVCSVMAPPAACMLPRISFCTPGTQQ